MVKQVPQLIGIVAMTPDRVIGKNGDLPWRIPEDLKLFREITSGHPIIMGRKTFESIGKPLPNRLNIVLTTQADWHPHGVFVVRKPSDLAELPLGTASKIFVIGGAEIYSFFQPFLDKLLVSRIFRRYSGDTKFPQFTPRFRKQSVLSKHKEFELQEYVPKDPHPRLFEYSEELDKVQVRRDWTTDPRRFLLAARD
ncbi:MAG: dihydrofolate reductase [Verrucomicrobiaceae bacterium]|nr:MAG: dihydrofolate reductase [Verrucomicrobiaceae bacterium]